MVSSVAGIRVIDMYRSKRASDIFSYIGPRTSLYRVL